MSFNTLIVLLVAIGVVVIFAMFPGARTLVKGFINLFIVDTATTPEGARAVFTEKIEQVQEAYNKADNFYKLSAGRLATTQKDMENLKTRLSKVESECESLVKNGRMDLAQVKAEEREEIISDISRCADKIKTYEAATAQAKETLQLCEKQLRDLKKKRKDVVENMKSKKELAEIHDGMDELKNVSATDKLLDSIMEKNKDLDAMAAGAKVVYDNKLSTKVQKAETEAKKLQSNDYLDSLMKKYNK